MRLFKVADFNSKELYKVITNLWKIPGIFPENLEKPLNFVSREKWETWMWTCQVFVSTSQEGADKIESKYFVHSSPGENSNV